jgi:hypothetical protein
MTGKTPDRSTANLPGNDQKCLAAQDDGEDAKSIAKTQSGIIALEYFIYGIVALDFAREANKPRQDEEQEKNSCGHRQGT